VSTGGTPTVFESFNARALEPEQVARTFVPSVHYERLSKRRHSLIVGPRGSGKTTLLKMLQGQALETWNHPLATTYRGAIDFTGIFIPTDVSWNAQLLSLGRGFTEPQAELLARAAFTTHVLRSMVLAIEYRTKPRSDRERQHFRRVVLEKNVETTFVRELSMAWRIDVPLPSLAALKYALSARLSLIRELASAEEHQPALGRGERLAVMPYLHLHYMQSAAQGIELFDDLVNESGARWAFLFDELELAPKWLTDELIRSLRSVDERFLFKLSISPFTSSVGHFTSPQSPKAGHDYDAIPLWYAHKEEGYDFCRRLLESMLVEAGAPSTDVREILGPSEFDARGDRGPTPAYTPGSRLQKRIVRMAESDVSFRRYLEMKQINPQKLHELSEDERAAEVRKIAPVLAVREAFRTPAGPRGARQQVRSRKNPRLYAGTASMFAIVEGNPRWLIGIVSRLLDDPSMGKGSINASRQSQEIQAAASRFRALLKTIPCPPFAQNRPRGVLSVIDPVGEYFFDAVVLSEFSADPPGSFIVDANASPELVDGLGKALNAGALVYVPDAGGELILESLRGKRFRLSYLLAPHYGLPLRLGRPVALSAVLSQQQTLPEVKDA
jgi:energy-coupling factor transporter ATP-binding protein EcfA2